MIVDWDIYSYRSPTDQVADLHQTRSQIRKVCLTILCLSVTLGPLVTFRTNSTQACSIPPPFHSNCPVHTAKYTITPVKGSTHLRMSAYKDHRGRGAMCIIAMVNRDRPTSLYCVFCCSGQAPQGAPDDVVMHSIHYGYPYAAADLLCLEGPGRTRMQRQAPVDLEKVLQYYAEEGTLEVIDRPINHFLKTSTGWEAQELEGDIHLNGQLTTMNE
ncbi:unnamed protein product [Coregonus sp. 'balchen']|nr:unnamed protein product [Coregonus sp. 'balchen']